ncbi:hypothetical protein K490DRAFT_67793 [Saccharata proteae CBS 121410]|uniref:N-acetyltransferase domain-containing protein n=1 Tax=Saccharata proteae CBS 121410 TaxID=1314787 RepID=A0A9P4HRN2_9PEZI|nr:hypothetical protein K490DRAFT_67793 [Saccharata proteae CBS 121410]
MDTAKPPTTAMPLTSANLAAHTSRIRELNPDQRNVLIGPIRVLHWEGHRMERLGKGLNGCDDEEGLSAPLYPVEDEVDDELYELELELEALKNGIKEQIELEKALATLEDVEAEEGSELLIDFSDDGTAKHCEGRCVHLLSEARRIMRSSSLYRSSSLHRSSEILRGGFLLTYASRACQGHLRQPPLCQPAAKPSPAQPPPSSSLPPSHHLQPSTPSLHHPPPTLSTPTAQPPSQSIKTRESQDVRDLKMETAASTAVQTKMQDPTLIPPHLRPANVAARKAKALADAEAAAAAAKAPAADTSAQKPGAISAPKPKAVASKQPVAKHNPRQSSTSSGKAAQKSGGTFAKPAQPARGSAAFNQTKAKWSQPRRPATGNQKSSSPPNASTMQPAGSEEARIAEQQLGWGSSDARRYPKQPDASRSTTRQQNNGNGRTNQQFARGSSDARNYPKQPDASRSNTGQQNNGGGAKNQPRAATKEDSEWVKGFAPPKKGSPRQAQNKKLPPHLQEPDWKTKGILMHPSDNPWHTEWKPSRHQPRPVNNNSKWVTNKEIRERAKKLPGSVSTDPWEKDNSNPDNDPYHDLKDLIDWQGNWMPGPSHWEHRKGFKGSRTFRDDVDKWMTRAEPFRKACVNESTKAAFEDPSACQVAPRLWAKLEVDGHSLQQWYDNIKKIPHGKIDDEFYIDDDVKPFWQMYTSSTSSLICPYTAPSDKMDETDVTNLTCRTNDWHNTSQGRSECREREEAINKQIRQKRLVKKYEHLRTPEHLRLSKAEFLATPKPGPGYIQPLKDGEKWDVRATVPANLIIPRGNVYLRPVETSDVGQLTALYNWHVENSVVCSTMKPVTTDFMASRITDVADSNLPFIVAVGRPRPKRGAQRPPPDAPPAAEQIVGYALAEDLESKQSMYRFTCDTELYVHNDWMQCNIGTALMDRLMYCLNPSYPWRGGYHMHPPKDGGNHSIYEFGGSRIIHSIVTNFAFDAEDSTQYDWTTTWMKKFGHIQVGLLPDVGIKNGKRVNQAIFHIRTGTTFEKDTMCVIASARDTWT